MKKKLKIAQIAPLWFPIPPKKYGGTERIIHYLTEGLVKRGHQVTLFASGNSKTRAKLISVTKKGLRARGIPWFDYTWTGLNTSIAFERAKEFDIIHCHWGFFASFFENFVKTPLLYTFHNIPRAGDHRWQILKYYQKKMRVVFISRSERKKAQVKFKKNWLVYNGVDVSQFKFNPKGASKLIWIGRVSPEKGIENAIRVAEIMKAELLLAGPVQEMKKDYFKQKIKPHLSRKIKYIGELSQKELSSFYGKAKAFLYPIEWEEPFGLCMAEAQACGTPVIAFNRGSVKEVIKDKKTGFVVPFKDKRGRKNIKGLVRALKKIDQIKREDCRKWVEKNFTIEKMVAGYEKIYYEILKSKKRI